MIIYMETLPMPAQLVIVFGGLFFLGALMVAVTYRLVKFGIKIKAGPVEIDASEENDKK